MNRLIFPFLLAFCALILSSCSKPRNFAVEDIIYITQKVGGHAIITQITPPEGPFNLVTGGSRYYKVAVPKTKNVYWVESFVSVGWSVATDNTVYRYHFYQKDLLGIRYWRVTL